MNLILAERASEELVDTFLENNDQIEKQSLLEKGYVVEIRDKIVGCFVLESVEDGMLWLKQLYITKAEASALPLLLETILTLAKQQQAKTVYVNSHQPMVDIILAALQFDQQTEKTLMDKYLVNNGKWWSYHVS